VPFWCPRTKFCTVLFRNCKAMICLPADVLFLEISMLPSLLSHCNHLTAATVSTLSPTYETIVVAHIDNSRLVVQHPVYNYLRHTLFFAAVSTRKSILEMQAVSAAKDHVLNVKLVLLLAQLYAKYFYSCLGSGCLCRRIEGCAAMEWPGSDRAAQNFAIVSIVPATLSFVVFLVRTALL